MKKIFTLLGCICLCGQMLLAQTQGGPDQFGYTWKDNNAVGGPTMNWIDITTKGTQVMGLGDDNVIGPFPIGIAFTYYWTQPTNFYVGSNGYVSFDAQIQLSSGNNPAFPNIPTADGLDNFLAPFLSDMNFDQTSIGEVFYWSNNVDSTVISFHNVPFWNQANDTAGSNTFQIILNAGDNSIRYQYQSLSGSYDPAYDAMTNPLLVGIENISGTDGLQVANDKFAGPRVIHFEYPDSTGFSVTDVKPDWINNDDNAGFFMMLNAPGVINGRVSNVGIVDVTTSFDVSTTIYKAEGSIPVGVAKYDESFSIGGLNQNQSMNFSYGPTFTPDTVGNFFIYTETNLAADQTTGNDQIETELVVIDTAGVPAVNLGFTDLTYNQLFTFEGAGVYYEPPFYPTDILSISAALTNSDSLVATDSIVFKIFDDDGANGLPGTNLLDTLVAAADIILIENSGGNMHTIILPTPIPVTSGGFYISVTNNAAAPNTRVITDTDGPFSFRTYEVISGIFGPYRSADEEDLFIWATMSVPTGIPPAPPVAGFGTSSLTVCEGESVSFFNHALTATSIDWIFDGGTPGTSTDENPVVTYNTAGTWTVTQNVSNASGNDQATTTVTVLQAVVADFTASTDTIDQGQTVSFTNNSQNSTGSFWRFGDGATSTSDDPVHQYNIHGSFTVELIAGNACGDDTASFVITVRDTTKPPDTTSMGLANRIDPGMQVAIFPNPTTGSVTVAAAGGTIERIEVYSLVGELLMTQNPNGSSVQQLNLDASQLPEGMYLIQVHTDKARLTKRITLMR